MYNLNRSPGILKKNFIELSSDRKKNKKKIDSKLTLKWNVLKRKKSIITSLNSLNNFFVKSESKSTFVGETKRKKTWKKNQFNSVYNLNRSRIYNLNRENMAYWIFKGKKYRDRKNEKKINQNNETYKICLHIQSNWSKF